ncbi:MAG TPA: adenosylcobinamide-phosphate synthase CbiB [Candidatus Acidoferrales bacterium]|nr:adenosylcobinamide-phosphate synthase CbiB [Candidatus Acidoferrales bacterium]
MSTPSTVLGAVLLDALIGDPSGLPHPVSVIAAATRGAERCARAYIGDDLRGGAAVTAVIVAGAAAAGAALDRAPFALRAVAAASTLAAKSLLDHAAVVRDALERGELAAARDAVARMVGRDTSDLDEAGVARAAIESLAESLCDGIVAPVMSLCAFGLPGVFACKAINTLDSLIGHLEPPYTRFGRVAARLDDLVNWIPARVSALLIALGAGCWGALVIAVRDGAKHRSPNAGVSEAAMAGALGVCLGGRSSYEGAPHDTPLLGAEFRLPSTGDLRRAMRVTVAAAALAYAGAVAFAWLRA